MLGGTFFVKGSFQRVPKVRGKAYLHSWMKDEGRPMSWQRGTGPLTAPRQESALGLFIFSYPQNHKLACGKDEFFGQNQSGTADPRCDEMVSDVTFALGRQL